MRDRHERDAIDGDNLDFLMAKCHDNGAVRERIRPRPEISIGVGKGTLERGDQQIGGMFDALLNLLLLEQAILLNEAPAKPHQDGQRHDGDGNDQRNQTPLEAGSRFGEHGGVIVQCTRALCRISVASVAFR